MFKADKRKKVYNLVTHTGEVLDRALRLKSYVDGGNELSDIDAAQLWEAKNVLENIWYSLEGDSHEVV